MSTLPIITEPTSDENNQSPDYFDVPRRRSLSQQKNSLSLTIQQGLHSNVSNQHYTNNRHRRSSILEPLPPATTNNPWGVVDSGTSDSDWGLSPMTKSPLSSPRKMTMTEKPVYVSNIPPEEISDSSDSGRRVIYSNSPLPKGPPKPSTNLSHPTLRPKKPKRASLHWQRSRSNSLISSGSSSSSDRFSASPIRPRSWDITDKLAQMPHLDRISGRAYASLGSLGSENSSDDDILQFPRRPSVGSSSSQSSGSAPESGQDLNYIPHINYPTEQSWVRRPSNPSTPHLSETELYADEKPSLISDITPNPVSYHKTKTSSPPLVGKRNIQGIDQLHHKSPKTKKKHGAKHKPKHLPPKPPKPSHTHASVQEPSTPQQKAFYLDSHRPANNPWNSRIVEESIHPDTLSFKHALMSNIDTNSTSKKQKEPQQKSPNSKRKKPNHNTQKQNQHLSKPSLEKSGSNIQHESKSKSKGGSKGGSRGPGGSSKGGSKKGDPKNRKKPKKSEKQPERGTKPKSISNEHSQHKNQSQRKTTQRQKQKKATTNVRQTQKLKNPKSEASSNSKHSGNKNKKSKKISRTKKISRAQTQPNPISTPTDKYAPKEVSATLRRVNSEGSGSQSLGSTSLNDSVDFESSSTKSNESRSPSNKAKRSLSPSSTYIPPQSMVYVPSLSKIPARVSPDIESLSPKSPHINRRKRKKRQGSLSSRSQSAGSSHNASPEPTLSEIQEFEHEQLELKKHSFGNVHSSLKAFGQQQRRPKKHSRHSSAHSTGSAHFGKRTHKTRYSGIGNTRSAQKSPSIYDYERERKGYSSESDSIYSTLSKVSQSLHLNGGADDVADSHNVSKNKSLDLKSFTNKQKQPGNENSASKIQKSRKRPSPLSLEPTTKSRSKSKSKSKTKKRKKKKAANSGDIFEDRFETHSLTKELRHKFQTGIFVFVFLIAFILLFSLSPSFQAIFVSQLSSI